MAERLTDAELEVIASGSQWGLGARLASEVLAARKALRSVEWGEGGQLWCPSCGAVHKGADTKHFYNCILARMIGASCEAAEPVRKGSSDGDRNHRGTNAPVVVPRAVRPSARSR